MKRSSPSISPLKVHGQTISWETPVIVGIINVTPDSFFDGGKNLNHFNAIESAENLIRQGATIIDVGGESTRPGSVSIDAKKEIERVLPVIHYLAEEGHIVSIDTMKPQVAQAALDAGASIVNDVSGGSNPEILEIVEDYGAAIVLGHMRGIPKTMQKSIDFSDVIKEVTKELGVLIETTLKVGISPENIIIDPGIGFGKTALQCSALMASAGKISCDLGFPIMVGPSNKSFIGAITGASVGNRDAGTISSSLLALLGGAQIFRVHDVAALKQAFDIAHTIIPLMEPCLD
jgi:dihydropteroate synthase